MKLIWNQAAGLLQLDADVADPADLLFLEHVQMQHAPESAALAPLARAARLSSRYTPCAQPAGDPPGVYRRLAQEGWSVFSGFDVPLAGLEFRPQSSPSERSRANAAARIGHAVFDALELLGRHPD